MNYPVRVLFLCTGNSARSQMAEGLLRHIGKGDFAVFSAGTEPRGEVHPLAIQAMQDFGIDISQQRSKDLAEFADQSFDAIITVCNRARDTCPTFPDDPEHIHWNYDDPVTVEGDEATRLKAFRAVSKDLHQRITMWVLTVRTKLRDQGITPYDPLGVR